MHARVIHLHLAAPSKPAIGAVCNGCGACCASEPCPAGMVLTLRLTGRCRLLRWSDAGQRYHCGLLVPSTALKRPTVWTHWIERCAKRWIAAGIGCDADFTAQPSALPSG